MEVPNYLIRPCALVVDGTDVGRGWTIVGAASEVSLAVEPVTALTALWVVFTVADTTRAKTGVIYHGLLHKFLLLLSTPASPSLSPIPLRSRSQRPGVVRSV